jgi:PKD repeat protein
MPVIPTPIISDFIASPQEGYSPLIVQFASTSTGGPITYYKWYFGDGNTSENTDSPQHTYLTPGIYSVGLEISGPLNTDSTTKYDYIIVNEFSPPSENTIVESYQNDSSNDWKFYVDADLHLVFSIGGDIYKTSEPVVNVGVWSLVEFHSGQNKMYVSTVDNGRKEVLCFKITNGVTGAHSEPKIMVAENTSIKIDELRVVKREENLTDYFRSLRGHVFYLH